MDKISLDIEKKVETWVGIFLLAIIILFGLSALGQVDWVLWSRVIVGFFLTGFLILAAGVVTYFEKKQYREFTFTDIFVGLAMVVAAGVFANTLMLIQAIRNVAPAWFINYSMWATITTAGVASLLAILFIVFPRIKKQ